MKHKNKRKHEAQKWRGKSSQNHKQEGTMKHKNKKNKKTMTGGVEPLIKGFFF